MDRPTITLMVTLLPSGRLDVSGPLGDKVLCYGMLEQAKDVIRAYEVPTVAPPTVEDLARLVGGH